jgi:signal transduction histidine kinase
MDEKSPSRSQRQVQKPEAGNRNAPMVFDVYVTRKNPLLEGLRNVLDQRNEARTALTEEKTAHAATKEALNVARIEIVNLQSEKQALKSENTWLQNELKRFKLFVAGMLHDVRTPLTGITGYATFVVEGWATTTKEKIKGHVDRILKISVRMHWMLTVLQDYMKAEAGRFMQAKARVDVVAELNGVVEMLLPMAMRNGVGIKVLTAENVTAVLDIRLLQHVMANIIMNAIKYNKQGGSVDITAKNSDGHVVIKISDTGLGMVKEDLGIIFDPYHRVDGSDRITGSGLGLMVVKKFTEIMGGTVSVESELGKGSTFTVTLPGVPAAVTLPGVPTETQGQN